MNTELHKRLEEAAESTLEGLNINCYIHIDGNTEDAYKDGFRDGGEWMFNECGGMTVLHDMRKLILAQCKAWLEKKTRFAKAQYCNCEDSEDEYYNGKADGLEAALADFEAEMNKLWEEQK